MRVVIQLPLPFALQERPRLFASDGKLRAVAPARAWLGAGLGPCSQYASAEYQTVLARHCIICSMNRKGDCWDTTSGHAYMRGELQVGAQSVPIRCKGHACMCSVSSKRLDVLGTQSSSQAARIADRVAAGGNTYQKPSSCRKKNIANVRPGLMDSTQTQRLSRYTLSLNWRRLMRIGDVSEGASHLSINLRKQYPSWFIALSMTLTETRPPCESGPWRMRYRQGTATSIALA